MPTLTKQNTFMAEGVGGPICTADFLIQINRGQIPGFELVHWFGDNNEIGNVEEDIWGQGGTMTYLTAAEKMDIVSSDIVNDIASANNARSVFITGLDGDFNTVSETVPLAATATETQNSYLRVFRLYVVDVGGYGNTNAGKITATASVAATVQSTIEIGEGQSTTTHYTVPAGKTGYILRISLTVEAQKQCHIHLKIRPRADIIVAPFKASRDVHHWEGIETPVGEDFNANHIFQEKTDLKFVANTVSGGVTATVQADYDLLIVDNVIGG